MEFPSSSQNHNVNSKSRNLKYPNKNKCVLCGALPNDYPGRIFHRFPKDPELSDKWAEITQKKWIMSTSAAKRYYRVCQNHFIENDFVSTKKIRLTKVAVPRLINPATLKTKLNQKLQSSAQQSMIDSEKLKTSEEIYEDEEDMSEEENNNDNNIPEIITFFKARVALDTLRKFLQQNDFSKKSLDMLSDIEKEMYASCPK